MKSKLIAVGFLIGLIAGFIVLFLFPKILDYALSFVHLSNSSLGYPAGNFSIKGGSFSNAISFVVVGFGLLGAVAGFIVFKIKQVVNKKNKF